MIYPAPKTKPIRLKGKAYTKFRKLVFEREDGKCQECGQWWPLNGFNTLEHGHVAHIINHSQGGSDTMDNVKWKCPTCHLKKEHGQ